MIVSMTRLLDPVGQKQSWPPEYYITDTPTILTRKENTQFTQLFTYRYTLPYLIHELDDCLLFLLILFHSVA